MPWTKHWRWKCLHRVMPNGRGKVSKFVQLVLRASNSFSRFVVILVDLMTYSERTRLTYGRLIWSMATSLCFRVCSPNKKNIKRQNKGWYSGQLNNLPCRYLGTPQRLPTHKNAFLNSTHIGCQAHAVCAAWYVHSHLPHVSRKHNNKKSGSDGRYPHASSSSNFFGRWCLFLGL